MTENSNKLAYFEGGFVPLLQANVNIQTHALQYGTACFGGIRGYWNKDQEQLFLFRLGEHYKRLENSARILFMKSPLSLDKMCEVTTELVRKNGYRQNIYIRPFLYKSALRISPRLHDVEDNFAIYTLPLDDYLDTNNGLRCCVSSWQRINDNTIPTRAKASGGYINSALAKSEAVLHGFDEAIFLDDKGNISEGSAENIFIVRDGKLITSSETSSILEGITRRTIINLARDEFGLEVIERDIARTELYVADEVFFSGTGVQIAWIKEIDYRIISGGKIGPISEKLQKLYFSIVTGNNSKYSDMLTKIY